jgi:hypothetical protein
MVPRALSPGRKYGISRVLCPECLRRERGGYTEQQQTGRNGEESRRKELLRNGTPQLQQGCRMDSKRTHRRPSGLPDNHRDGGSLTGQIAIRRNADDMLPGAQSQATRKGSAARSPGMKGGAYEADISCSSNCYLPKEPKDGNTGWPALGSGVEDSERFCVDVRGGYDRRSC